MFLWMEEIFKGTVLLWYKYILFVHHTGYCLYHFDARRHTDHDLGSHAWNKTKGWLLCLRDPVQPCIVNESKLWCSGFKCTLWRRTYASCCCCQSSTLNLQTQGSVVWLHSSKKQHGLGLYAPNKEERKHHNHSKSDQIPLCMLVMTINKSMY